MTFARTDILKTTEWLAAHLDDRKVRVLDASFHVPTVGRDPREEYAQGHIPGALFFDIDAIRDEATDLPHMLPAPDRFADAVGNLGIANDDLVVVYDAPDSAAAPRAWWMFRVFGHDKVAVLDGGLAKWMAEGRAVEDTPPDRERRSFTAGFRPELVRSCRDLLTGLEGSQQGRTGGPPEQIIDNRSPGRFMGLEAEPRPARKQGHIPGSVNIPFTSFLDLARHGVWQPQEELAEIFAEAGIELNRPMVASCGSGVTACSTAFAASLLGHDHVAIYDGSWTEWGNRDDTPVES